MARWITVPDSTVRLLSVTEKMPCLSWSLPPIVSCPFMVIGANHICSKCYGQRGHYIHKGVKNAQDVRFAWTVQSLRTKQGTDDWIAYMIAAIRAENYGGVFRAHDDGDLFSPLYVRAWIAVCQALPCTLFWFPTRSWQAPWWEELVLLNSLPNVVVRPSALEFEQDPPIIPGLSAGSGAKRVGYNCPAHEQGNKCLTCRRCWEDPEHTTFFKARG